MRTILSGTLVALGTLLCLASTGLANGYGWPGREQRPSHQAAAYVTDMGTRQLAHMQEAYVNGEELPPAYSGRVNGSRGPASISSRGGVAASGCPSCGGGCCGGVHCGSGGHCGGYCHGGYCGDDYWCGDGYGCDDGYWCGDVYGCPGGPWGHGHHHGHHGHHAPGMCYAEVHTMFLRAHLSEQAIGKLSEKYEYSPRFVFGCELPSGWGARARYWWYHQTTRNLDFPINSLRLEFDVIDVEATHRFRTSHGDLVLSGGARWAKMVAGVRNQDPQITFPVPDVFTGAEMLGLTLAADCRSTLLRHRRCEVALVGGARWSILAGDWEGQPLINPVVESWRDDNVVVKELYGGVEALYVAHGCSVFARAAFEMQNWRSDAMQWSHASSLTFLGPAFHAGVAF